MNTLRASFLRVSLVFEGEPWGNATRHMVRMRSDKKTFFMKSGFKIWDSEDKTIIKSLVVVLTV
jgi:hypothetical protein